MNLFPSPSGVLNDLDQDILAKARFVYVRRKFKLWRGLDASWNWEFKRICLILQYPKFDL